MEMDGQRMYCAERTSFNTGPGFFMTSWWRWQRRRPSDRGSSLRKSVILGTSPTSRPSWIFWTKPSVWLASLWVSRSTSRHLGVVEGAGRICVVGLWMCLYGLFRWCRREEWEQIPEWEPQSGCRQLPKLQSVGWHPTTCQKSKWHISQNSSLELLWLLPSCAHAMLMTVMTGYWLQSVRMRHPWFWFASAHLGVSQASLSILTLLWHG